MLVLQPQLANIPNHLLHYDHLNQQNLISVLSKRFIFSSLCLNFSPAAMGQLLVVFAQCDTF